MSAENIALERLRELQRLAEDPDTKPAIAEQARIDAALLAHGLAAVQAARGRLEETRSERWRLQQRAELLATVRAYRVVLDRGLDHRPTQEEVAEARRISERTLATRLREFRIVDSWHDVHALVEAMP